MKHSKQLAVVTVVAMALVTPLQAYAETSTVDVKPGKSHEKCVSMGPEQTLEYRFESGAKLNYAIQYQKGDATQTATKLEKTTSASGLFTAKASSSYCMMWENATEEVVALNYTYKLVENIPEKSTALDKGPDKADKLGSAEKSDKPDK